MHDAYIDSGFGANAYLTKDVECLACGEAVIVLTARSDDESAHIQSARTDEVVIVAFGSIAVGTVGTARYHDDVHSFALAVGDDIHAGLVFAICHGQTVVDRSERLLGVGKQCLVGVVGR